MLTKFLALTSRPKLYLRPMGPDLSWGASCVVNSWQKTRTSTECLEDLVVAFNIVAEVAAMSLEF